ncbi:hypothetical protein OHA25_33430 [Nonomuraea sp. NBC_00507]|uniref:hypothetical protein n=1 Tax=Nonomuraea sp. NBC_00507 TaxID=2976002 RepID=UPI002E183C50
MMRPFNSRNRKKWPTIDIWQPAGRGDIKTLTVESLGALVATAQRHQWSAEGRPEWLRAHRDRLRQLFLVIFGKEDASVYRCIVAVILNDDSEHSFTLDVAADDFDALPDLGYDALVTLGHSYIARFEHVPLDPSQEAAWRSLEDGDGG